jgi:hypothetical protein
MLNEHVGVVLKNVMDGKGKRLEINVRPVFAAEFQIILEGRARTRYLAISRCPGG